MGRSDDTLVLASSEFSLYTQPAILAKSCMDC